MNQVLLVTSP